MLTTVKIGKAEYKAIKELAKDRGQFLSYHLNLAIRQYLEANKSKANRQVA